MATRDVIGRLRNRRIPLGPAALVGTVVLLSTVVLAACAPPNLDVVTATICVTPESAAVATHTAMHLRIDEGGYGTASAARFGSRYIDLADEELRVRAHCCGRERVFKECMAGATPVDLIVDIRREMTPEDREQLSRQLATELDAALESVQP